MVFEGHDQWPVDVVGTTSEFAPILRLNLAAGRFVSPLDGWEPFAVIGAGSPTNCPRRADTDLRSGKGFASEPRFSA